MPISKKAKDLHAVVDLLDDAIALVKKALNHNPTVAEERDLEQILLRLEAERSVLQAEYDDALEGATGVQGPTPAQVQQVADLSNQVATATTQAQLSSDAIALGGRIFDLAGKIVKHA